MGGFVIFLVWLGVCGFWLWRVGLWLRRGETEWLPGRPLFSRREHPALYWPYLLIMAAVAAFAGCVGIAFLFAVLTQG